MRKFNFVLLVSVIICQVGILKGALQGLRQFLAPESPLKKMKNVF